jgi:hypothetical protein
MNIPLELSAMNTDELKERAQSVGIRMTKAFTSKTRPQKIEAITNYENLINEKEKKKAEKRLKRQMQFK